MCALSWMVLRIEDDGDIQIEESGLFLKSLEESVAALLKLFIRFKKAEQKVVAVDIIAQRLFPQQHFKGAHQLFQGFASMGNAIFGCFFEFAEGLVVIILEKEGIIAKTMPAALFC